MEKNPFKWPILVIAGILVWLTELWFNLPSILLWPGGDFSPFVYYHSQLGDPGLNSAIGAQFYNSGQVFQGLSILLFAGGIYILYGEKTWQRAIMILGQLSAFILGFALIMNGVYSVNFQPEHGLYSEILFYNIFIAEVLVNIPLLFKSKLFMAIGVFGLIAAAVNLFFVVGYDLLPAGQFIEWIGIYVAEGWLGIITIGVFYTEVWKKD
jgi:hypothetical protein